jgi:virulence-associated protein VagC
MQMKTKVTEQGVRVPKKFLKGIKEVEIRKDNGVVLVVPVAEDPILALGSQPIADEITDGSELHDRYLYGR